MFFTLYEIFTLSFKFNEVVSGVMNSKVDEFLSCLNNEIENKTDKYWLEQVVFEIGDDQNLNIVVNSEFIKNSIEKKVFATIKRVYKNINKFGDCVFVLDKTLSIPTNEFEIVEEVEVVEDTPIQNQTSYELGVFDELFIGSCNNLAITAAKNVVTSPGKRFNPLFVYGKPGVEFNNFWQLTPAWRLEADLSWTHGRFQGNAPEGNRIPGAVPFVASGALSYAPSLGPFATLRLRHLGAYPLTEDNIVKSRGSTLVNLALGWRWRRLHAQLDVLNALDAEDHDIDYFYASRLPGEPEAGLEDIHFKRLEPRQLRVTVTLTL